MSFISYHGRYSARSSLLTYETRPAGPSETETAREAQERVVREVWKRVQPLDYHRP